MNTHDGYKKLTLDNTLVLLAGGGHKSLSDFALSNHNHDTIYTKKTQAIPFVVGNTTGTAGTWTGNCADIDAYYDGLSIMYLNGIAGAATTTLNINGLGACTCYYTGTTKLTTHYAVGSAILLTYYGGTWRRADYTTANDNYLAGNYYTRAKINASGYLGCYMIVGKCPDGTITGLCKTNNAASSTTKTMYTGPLLLDEFYYYSTTTTYAANANFTTNNVLWDNYSLVDIRYTFNCNGLLTGKEYLPFFIVLTKGNDGYFYLNTTQAWRTGIPDLTVTDNNIYVFLGYVYPDTTPYRISFEVIKKAYMVRNGVFTEYNEFNGSDYVKKAGDTMTGDLARKSSHNLAATNNGISSTIYPTTFNILDSQNRISIRLENIVTTTTNAFYLYAKSYDSSGTSRAQRGLKYQLTKPDSNNNVTGTWTVDDAASFRSAISVYSKEECDSKYVIDAGSSITSKIYAIETKRVFSGLNLADAPVTGWVSGLVLGSNWNNNHYQHYLVEGGNRWYTTRSYTDGSMNNWNTFAYLSDLPTKSSWNYDDRYVKKSGDTMTGVLHMLDSQYADTAETGALDLANSDIYGVNSIKFADACDGAAEGLLWYRDSTHIDSLWVKTGVMYFTPNRTWGGTATNYIVLHHGNVGLYVGGSGNLTANAAQSTNGNVYLTLKAANTYFKHNIVGATGISVTSDANGKITITGTTYAATGHTHPLSIATTTDNSSISLSDSTKYKLTAGGSTYVFTTPVTATRLRQSAITDLATFTHGTDLIYAAAGGSNTVADKPADVTAFGVLSFKVADGYYGQILLATTGELYFRQNNTLNGGWKKVIDTANINNYNFLTALDHYKTSPTAGTAGTSSATSGSTLAVPYVTVNANGHVTGYGTHTHTISGFLTAHANSYGKITPANSTAVTALTGNTTAVQASSSSENLKLSAANKWVVLAGTNSGTAGSDELKIGHALSGVTAGTAGTSSATSGSTLAVPYVTYDAAGHITAAGTHTHTITGFVSRLYTTKQLTAPGWYRVAQLITYGTAYLVSIGESYNNGNPTPSTFIVSTGYTTASATQINRACRATTNIDGIRVVRYLTGRHYLDVHYKNTNTSGNNEHITLMNLDRESGIDGITLIDWTAQSDTLPSGETLDASATVIGNITAGTAGTSSATSGNSFSIPYVTVNESGYVTAYGTHTHTVSDTDTKVTQTLTTTSNTSFRPLLLGYTYSDANPPNSFATVTNSVYAQHNVFIRPSTGELFVGNSVTANGSFVAKVAHNLAAADNGVSSTTWRGFYVQDSAGRISAQLSNGVYSNGNNHAWFGVRNFNTSGTMTADVGLGITAAKDGTLSWSVSGPNQFRQAIQAVRAIYGTYTSANALTDRGHALVMCNLAGTNTTVNPNGQTGWHHFINMTWSDAADLNGVTNNEWGTQIANKCGTTDLWVRSCNGITITDGTAWTAPWVRILTGSNWTNVITLSSLGAASSGHLHDSRYVLKAGDTMTGSLTVSNGGGYHLKFDVDTSRMNGYDWLNSSGTSVAGVFYHNTEQNIILNSVYNEVSSIWTDAVGKYSLFVGKNKFTYNACPIVLHRSLGSDAITAESGTFFFSGSGTLQSGEDYVGYQVGDSVDKWQMVAFAANLRWRQNDSGGANSANWNAFKTILDSTNSSVSGGGSSWGSSITVKINGTSKTLTIPSNPSGNYVLKTGDTMSGSLTIANSSGLSIVDPSYVHDAWLGWATYNSVDYFVNYAYETKYWPMTFGTHPNAIGYGGLCFAGSDGNYYWGIGTLSPSYKFDVQGTGRFTSQLTLSVAQGTAPLVITSTTLCSNLNADLLDGRHGAEYAMIGTLASDLGSGTNLNNILYAGTYTCQAGSTASNFSNTPYKDGNFRVWHIVNTGTDGNSSQWSAQLLLAPNEPRMFIRGHTSGGFTSWKEFAFKSDISGFLTSQDHYSSGITGGTLGGTDVDTSGATITLPYAGVNVHGHITGFSTRTHTVTGFLTSQDHYKTSPGAGTAGTSSATSGGTLAVPYITVNANGHVTAKGTHTHTVNELCNYYTSRPSSANLSPDGSGKLRHFKATSSMTTANGHPGNDGHILWFSWDNTGGYDAQFCIPTSASATTRYLMYRGQSGSSTWGDWQIVVNQALLTSTLLNYAYISGGTIYIGDNSITPGTGTSGSYLPLAGGNMTGMIGFSNFESNSKIWFKGNTRGAGWKYDYNGNEALIISSGTYDNSSICFWSSNAGTLSDSGGQWNSVVPSMAIKGPHVTIGAAAQADRALYVKTTDGTGIGIVSSSTYCCINYALSSSYSWSAGSNSSGLFYFWNTNGSTTKAYFDSSGTLACNGVIHTGLSSNRGDYVFTCDGNYVAKSSLGGGGSSGITVSTVTLSTTSYYPMMVTGTGSKTTAYIANPSSGAKFYATSAGVYFTSDIQLKTNISRYFVHKELTENPVRKFDWKNGDGNNIIGFVAQEVEQWCPEAIHINEDGYKSLNYNATLSALCGYLFDKVKELENTIKILKDLLNANKC